MAVAHRNTAKAHFNSNETTPATGSLTFLSGGLGIVSVCGYQSGVSNVLPTSVKLDGSGASFTNCLDSGDFSSGTDHIRISVWRLENIAAGAHTATVTFSSAGVTTLFLTEVTGCATSSASDGTGTFASGSTTTPASGSFVAGATDDFWWSVVTGPAWTNPATFSATSPWTIPTNGTETDSSSWLCGGVEYINNPGTNTENGQWTTKSGLNICTVSAFKVLAGGGGALSVVPTFTLMNLQ